MASPTSCVWNAGDQHGICVEPVVKGFAEGAKCFMERSVANRAARVWFVALGKGLTLALIALLSSAGSMQTTTVTWKRLQRWLRVARPSRRLEVQRETGARVNQIRQTARRPRVNTCKPQIGHIRGRARCPRWSGTPRTGGAMSRSRATTSRTTRELGGPGGSVEPGQRWTSLRSTLECQGHQVRYHWPVITAGRRRGSTPNEYKVK